MAGKKDASGMIALRYVSALIDLAGDQNALKTIEGNINTLSALYNESHEFRYLMHTPLLSRTKKVQAMQNVAGTLQLHALTANFLSLLAQNRRLPMICNMVDAFRRECARRRGEVMADVQTAAALTDAQTKALKKALKEMLGSDIGLNVKVNEDLIGGLRITVGSQMIDNSVRRKLERLRRDMKKNTAQQLTEVA